MTEHTPGPWRWEFNEKHRQLTLVGGRQKYDLTIMEFCRWDMWGAGVSMRDTRPEAEGFNLMHKVHERPDWIIPFPGRAHHKDWCAAVAHPDMRLMQTAPELLDDLVEAAAILRRYEGYHRAKNTEESTAKAEVNAQLAARFEATIAKARGQS